MKVKTMWSVFFEDTKVHFKDGIREHAFLYPKQSGKIPAKEAVIPPANTVPQPWTVVIKVLHAVIANRTV